MLEPLELVDDIGHGGLVDLDAEFSSFQLHRRSARQVPEQEPRAVPDSFGVNVLVAVGAASNGARMQTRLVGECRRADVGLLILGRHVHQFGHVMRDRGEAGQALARHGLDAHLEREIRHEHGVVAIAGALAIAVHRSLHVRRTGNHTCHCVCHGAAGVVLGVHADLDAVEVLDHLAHDLFDLMGQRTSVGVAQHQAIGTVHRRCLEHRQRELWVALVTVEEMLRIEEDAQPLPLEKLDRVADHGDALAERLTECFGYVVVPRLAHDAHGGSAGCNERSQGLVVVDAAPRPASGAEGHQCGVLQHQLGRRPREELLVLGIRAGPAAFDPMNAQCIELTGHLELVIGRHRNALELDAISQRCVEYLDSLRPRGVAHALSHERGR